MYKLKVYEPRSAWELAIIFEKSHFVTRWEIHPATLHRLGIPLLVPQVLWKNYEQLNRPMGGYIGIPMYLNSEVPRGELWAEARSIFWQED